MNYKIDSQVLFSFNFQMLEEANDKEGSKLPVNKEA